MELIARFELADQEANGTFKEEYPNYPLAAVTISLAAPGTSNRSVFTTRS